MQWTLTIPEMLILAMHVGSTLMMSADVTASVLYDLDFGTMMDQPCEFDSFDGQGDQIQLDLNDFAASEGYALRLAATGNGGAIKNPEILT